MKRTLTVSSAGNALSASVCVLLGFDLVELCVQLEPMMMMMMTYNCCGWCWCCCQSVNRLWKRCWMFAL